MKIAASFLDIKEPVVDEVLKLSREDIDYLHLDVMDGIFVENKTYTYEEFYNIVKNTNKPKDVHLMVSDVKKHIDEYVNIKPEFITFHYEAVSDISSVINYIHQKGIKVGISIKPATDVTEIFKYLKYVDLVLVMSVEPGKGGQSFIQNSVNKIQQLYDIRNNNNYNYLIQVDGGINADTIKLCNKVDIVVVGSFITKNNYKDSIERLKNEY